MAVKSTCTSLSSQESLLAPTMELWYWWTSTRGGGGFRFQICSFYSRKKYKNSNKKYKEIDQKTIKNI